MDTKSTKGEIRRDWNREMVDAPGKKRAHSLEIFAHVPAPATVMQTLCSVRRSSFEIPIGGRANFCCVARLGVTQCPFSPSYFLDGFASHVAR